MNIITDNYKLYNERQSLSSKVNQSIKAKNTSMKAGKIHQSIKAQHYNIFTFQNSHTFNSSIILILTTILSNEEQTNAPLFQLIRLRTKIKEFTNTI